MNTFAYVSSLLAKSQTAFVVANAAGIEPSPELTTVVSKLQAVCNVAEGYQVPNTAANAISDAERLITSGLFDKAVPLSPGLKTVLGDLATLVNGKGSFNATFSIPVGSTPVAPTVPVEAAEKI